MTKCDCRRNFIDVLPTRTGGAGERFLQVRFVKFKIVSHRIDLERKIIGRGNISGKKGERRNALKLAQENL